MNPKKIAECVRTARRNQTRLGPRHGLLNRGLSQGIGLLQSLGPQSHISVSFGLLFADCQSVRAPSQNNIQVAQLQIRTRITKTPHSILNN